LFVTLVLSALFLGAVSRRYFMALSYSGRAHPRRRAAVINAAFFVAGEPASGHEWPGI
jgi:hypothetical protein